jgi:WD40 repeat protein
VLSIEVLQFSRGGKWLVASSSYGTVVWDVQTGAARALKEEGRESTRSRTVTLSPDDKTILEASSQRVVLWDIDSGKQRPLDPSGERSIRQAAFSPDGATVLAETSGGRPLLWKAADGASVALEGPPAGEREESYSNGASYAAGGSAVFCPTSKGPVLWSTLTGKRLPLPVPPECKYLSDIALSPDGNTAAAFSGGDYRMVFWDLPARTASSAAVPDKRYVSKLLFDPQGKILVAFCLSDDVLAFDARTGKMLSRIPTSIRARGTRENWLSADLTRLAVPSEGAVLIYDLTSGQVVGRVEDADLTPVLGRPASGAPPAGGP